MFAALFVLISGTNVWAQCLSLPGSFSAQIHDADKIVEGQVVSQTSFLDADGNIYTNNHVEVYRVLKGDVGFELDVVTEGGVVDGLMQVVTPSVQLPVGAYGLVVINNDSYRSINSLANAFYEIDQRTNTVLGLKHTADREEAYEVIARHLGTSIIEMRRMPLVSTTNANGRAEAEVASVFPLHATAGTQTVITIAGQGFGATKGSGKVAFKNADDGGQSFVNLPEGPHYLSWSDTEIQIYVPSSTLFNTTVAGTGVIRVTTDNGSVAESVQELTVDFAKSEVIYSENLNSTMLVGPQSGGYVFTLNNDLRNALGGAALAANVVEKWACNTGVNFTLEEEVVATASYAHDDINLLGLSAPGQLPNYLLGRTVTTFSSCGSPGSLQWNMIEVDILLNSDIDWWISEAAPMTGRFDLITALLHELGHAHLLQHNNNLGSPMYFQLTEGAMRRDLDFEADVEGGEYISYGSAGASSVCSDGHHELYDFETCNLSLINGVADESPEGLHVYPNPFADNFSIVTESGVALNYELYDTRGKLILAGTVEGTADIQNLSGLQKGLYLLHISNDSVSTVHRLIKN